VLGNSVIRAFGAVTTVIVCHASGSLDSSAHCTE
jgi:hypothetical protein